MKTKAAVITSLYHVKQTFLHAGQTHQQGVSIALTADQARFLVLYGFIAPISEAETIKADVAPTDAPSPKLKKGDPK